MDRPLHLFSYGGVLFWMISSVIFAEFYAVVMALPVLPCRRWLAPPNQKSFYHYMFFMLLLNIIQVCIPWSHKTSNRVNLWGTLYSKYIHVYICLFFVRPWDVQWYMLMNLLGSQQECAFWISQHFSTSLHSYRLCTLAFCHSFSVANLSSQRYYSHIRLR